MASGQVLRMGAMDARIPQDLRSIKEQAGETFDHHMRIIAHFIKRLLRTIFDFCTTRNPNHP
jgi:hypothetical protein